MDTSEVQRLRRISTYFLSEINGQGGCTKCEVAIFVFSLLVQVVSYIQCQCHTTGLRMNYMMPFHKAQALLEKDKIRQSHREEKT